MNAGWASLVGFSLGVGIASLLYLRVFTRALTRLHEDNVEAANRLEYSDQHVSRKVEEQNMSALSKRLDMIEDKLNRST